MRVKNLIKVITMVTHKHTIPTQGLHHITLTGAGRQITLDFWEGVLGMPFILSSPILITQRKAIFILIRVMIA